MADLQEFPTLFDISLEDIRARMDQDGNAGLVEDDPAFVDTRPGSYFYDTTHVCALECARIWDAFTETAAAAFPNTAWGEYLDKHGETFQLTRNPPVAATGEVLFIASEATLIPTNTNVSAIPSDPSLDPMTFSTTESDTTCPQLDPPASVVVTPSGSGGTLTAGGYIYHVTARNSFGETTGSADQTGTIVGSTGSNALTWDEVTDAIGYRVYRTLTANTPGRLVADVVTAYWTDDGSITPLMAEPVENTTSGVRLAVSALVAGSAGNLASYSLTTLDTPIPNVTAVMNEAPTVGGADEEGDEGFRPRVVAQFSSHGGGNAGDYARWALAHGAERVYVEAIWDGPGTVLVVIMLGNGSPVSDTVVADMQSYLDPTAGLGQGQAPIGAIVTVHTSTVVTISFSATVIHESGFSLDGTAGGVATRASIVQALDEYVTSLSPGDTLVYQHVLAAFFVDGVHDVTGLLVQKNAGTPSDVDITLASGATPEAATVGTIELS